MSVQRSWPRSRTAAACLALCFSAASFAQEGTTKAPAPTGGEKPASTAPARAEKPPIKQEELDQILAPIALYPDSLLSQIFMASTYPLEIVQADRWVKQNKDLKGDALAKALEKTTWDPSVKSLVNCATVLAMLSEKIDWTAKLGDAFLAQPKEVMDTVQKLRAKAQAEGNLKTTKEQTVVVEGEPQVIKIESSSPQVIYVPTYNPTVVYGTWWYPSYPPYYYRPPGYYAAGAFLSFGIGVAWGYAWGSCNWGHSDVDIDINRNTNINNNIDRDKYKNQINQRDKSAKDGRGKWQHDGSHRQGVSYRDQATAKKFGGASSPSVSTREAYRGRAEAGRQDPGRGSGAQTKNLGNTGRAAGTPSAGTRDVGRAGSGSRGGAFDGIDRGAQSTRAMSSRGQSSLSSAGRSGGGSRGGGGRGGRGGGGGRR